MGIVIVVIVIVVIGIIVIIVIIMAIIIIIVVNNRNSTKKIILRIFTAIVKKVWKLAEGPSRTLPPYSCLLKVHNIIIIL